MLTRCVAIIAKAEYIQCRGVPVANEYRSPNTILAGIRHLPEEMSVILLSGLLDSMSDTRTCHMLAPSRSLCGHITTRARPCCLSNCSPTHGYLNGPVLGAMPQRIDFRRHLIACLKLITCLKVATPMVNVLFILRACQTLVPDTVPMYEASASPTRAANDNWIF